LIRDVDDESSGSVGGEKVKRDKREEPVLALLSES